jgi:hypothetical protein
MKAVISAVVLGSAVLLAPSFASAQENMEGYVVDRFGNPLINVQTGTCVQSRYWTPANASPRCKPTTTPASASSRAPKK